MSVKGKVKRLNREVEYLNSQIDFLLRTMKHDRFQHEHEKAMFENLIKFFVVNQVGKPAEGGVHIDRDHIDKLDSLGVNVWYDFENEAYVIKLKEVNDE